MTIASMSEKIESPRTLLEHGTRRQDLLVVFNNLLMVFHGQSWWLLSMHTVAHSQSKALCESEDGLRIFLEQQRRSFPCSVVFDFDTR